MFEVIRTLDFDKKLQVKRVDVLNSINGTDLIANKSAVARVWVNFSSNLIDELDRAVKLSFYAQGYRIDCSRYMEDALGHITNWFALGKRSKL